MNQQYDNTNSGALFKNDKEGNDKRPDYKGKIDINGTEYRLSAWIRTKKDGSGGKFMSLKAEPMQPTQERPTPRYPSANAGPQTDQQEEDDIPF